MVWYLGSRWQGRPIPQDIRCGVHFLYVHCLIRCIGANKAAVKAKAIYDYTGGSEDELPFAAGDEIDIIDRSDEEWWKTEKNGVVFIVPAAYFEEVQG